MNKKNTMIISVSSMVLLGAAGFGLLTNGQQVKADTIANSNNQNKLTATATSTNSNTQNSTDQSRAVSGTVSTNMKAQNQAANLNNQSTSGTNTSDQADVSKDSFYNNPNNGNTSVTANDINFNTQLNATNKDGSVQTTSAGNGSSIINPNNISSINQTGTISNESQTVKNINTVFTLPKYPSTNSFGMSVTEKPTIDTTDLTNSFIGYSAAPGEYLVESEYLKKHSWDQLYAIQIKGDLAANGKIALNVKLANPVVTIDQLNSDGKNSAMNIQALNYTLNASHTGFDLSSQTYQMRFAVPVSNKKDVNGFVGISKNKDGSYSLLPKDIQDQLALIASKDAQNDISYENFNWINSPTNNEDTLYSGSKYNINLDKIINNIKNMGYTVAWNSDNSLMTNYTEANLSAADVGTFLSKDNKFPVELFKVIDASDSTLKVGEKFDPLKNVKGTAYDGTDITSKLVIADKTVDTNKPGVYNVTYSYAGKDFNVSKTVKVTVRSTSGGGSSSNNNENGFPYGTKFEMFDTDAFVINNTGAPAYVDGFNNYKRKLENESGWKVDKKLTLPNGDIYYRVSTNEYLKDSDVVLGKNKNEVVFVINSKGAPTYLDTKNDVGRVLDDESAWKTDRTVMINGEKYYRVSTNEYIKSSDVIQGIVQKGIIKIVNPLGAKMYLDADTSNVDKTRQLSKNSLWIFDRIVKVNNHTYYRVATNDWVDSNDVNLVNE